MIEESMPHNKNYVVIKELFKWQFSNAKCAEENSRFLTKQQYSNVSTVAQNRQFQKGQMKTCRDFLTVRTFSE